MRGKQDRYRRLGAAATEKLSPGDRNAAKKRNHCSDELGNKSSGPEQTTAVLLQSRKRTTVVLGRSHPKEKKQKNPGGLG
mmetsp:Transcript_12283/g.26026  ORF Transcript_12283/g.26026 Transcript_12283/m.26026 type:complete len:80 (+) Transcript_12283:440-679(+)